MLEHVTVCRLPWLLAGSEDRARGTFVTVNGRVTRLYLWVPAAILGFLGVYGVGACLVSGGQDPWLSVLWLSTALFLPAVLYLLTLPRYLQSGAEGPDLPRAAGTGPGAFHLVLSVALYLPCMIVMANTNWWAGWSWPPEPIPVFLLRFVPFSLILWMFCACTNKWLREEHIAVPAENGRPPSALHRSLEMTNRFLPSPVSAFSAVESNFDSGLATV